MSLLADSKGPDQTARMRSLISTFAVRIFPQFSHGAPEITSFELGVGKTSNIVYLNKDASCKLSQPG